jgi:dipeptidyl aminopeptidase/acylaminoacyl peptidase
VAYANEEGRIIVHDLAGGTDLDLSVRGRPVRDDDVALVDNWPTWSPDGERVAFVRIEAAAGEVRRASVWVISADGESSAEVYSATDAGPIYMAWAPDGERLGILVQSGNTLALRVVDARSPRPPITVAQGQPLYFAWCADSHAIVAHIGSPGLSASPMRLVLIRLRGGSATRENLPRAAAAGFRAPSWSTRFGALTLAFERGDGAEIVVQETPESLARTFVETGPAPSYVWSPNGDLLAFAARDPDAPNSYLGLLVVSAEGGEPRTLTQESLLAYCWSQDSAKLISCAGGVADRLVHLVAIDVATGSQVDLGWLRPSRDFWFMLGHFDQYSVSMPLVTANSEYVLLAASHAKESENGVVPTVREVLARPISGEGPDIVIGRGSTACCAPG